MNKRRYKKVFKKNMERYCEENELKVYKGRKARTYECKVYVSVCKMLYARKVLGVKAGKELEHLARECMWDLNGMYEPKGTVGADRKVQRIDGLYTEIARA